MKRTILSLIIIFALIVLIGDKAPEHTLTEFYAWKASAGIILIIAGSSFPEKDKKKKGS